MVESGRIWPKPIIPLLQPRKPEDRDIPIVNVPDENEKDKDLTNAQRLGNKLAKKVDVIVVSHVDPDHFDPAMVKEMMDKNSDLQIWGPLGWKDVFTKGFTFEEDPEEVKKGKSVMPDSILKRLHTFDPAQHDPDRVPDPGLRGFYKHLLPMDMTVVGDPHNPVTIKSYEMPHVGTPAAEYVQMIWVENRKSRYLFVNDAPASPELLDSFIKMQMEMEQKGQKLTGIFLSAGLFNPEPFHGYGTVEWANRFRDKNEEVVSHSSGPIIAVTRAIFGMEVPVVLTHHGFFYNESSDPKWLMWRVPTEETTLAPEETGSWLKSLKSTIQDRIDVIGEKFKTLPPLSGDRSRTSLKDYGNKSRVDFTRTLVQWIKDNPVPREVMESFVMAQANTVYFDKGTENE